MEARTHTNIIELIKVNKINSEVFIVLGVPKKNVVVSTHIIKILIYSAINIIAKDALLYSILNPETNSDSPSTRSNGVRLVSARFVMVHKINIGNSISSAQDFMFIFIKFIFIEW